MRVVANRAAHYGFTAARKVVAKNPRVKHMVKRVVRAQFGLHKNKDPYQQWVDRNFPDFIGIARLHKELETLTYRPLISILVPTYNTDIDFLHDCIDSVLGQVYDNWELILVDDASPNANVRDTVKQYASQDDRICYKFLTKNHHIAGASNIALDMAKGEFVALLDHDDMLWPNALFEVVRALNSDKTIDFMYTDEDKIGENRFEHFGPFFKPDWNPDFLHSVNYITHLSVTRTQLMKQLGGLRADYNGAQDWDLFLRITRTTKKIHHIPKMLYSWRVHDLSTAKSVDSKPYVVEAQRSALIDDLKAKNVEGATVEQDAKHKGYWCVTRALQGEPLISIVIPSKNQYKVVKRCIDSIYKKSTYRNFEVVLVDTGSTDKNVLRWYKKLQQRSNITLIDWPEQPFSYSRSCNEGARVAKGEIIIMLNNDTEVITPDWIEQLASDAQRDEIGAVGCLLFFPDKVHIQHAGVGVGLGGVAANSFSMMTLNQYMNQTQHLMINTKHNMTVVTAACLAIRKSVFEDVNGFAEEFRVTYNDVDLCLRLHDKGYQNLYTPYARLLHHESISVGSPSEVKKRDTKEFRDAKNLFIKRWAKYVAHDPNLNPNLSKDNAFYDVPSIKSAN